MFSFQAKTQKFFLLSFCLGFLFPFSLSCLAAQSFWLFATLWIVARQAPLSMGFSRQKYWSELPFSFPFLSPEGSTFCLLHIYPHSLCSNQDWKDPHMNISNPNLLSEHHMPYFAFYMLPLESTISTIHQKLFLTSIPSLNSLLWLLRAPQPLRHLKSDSNLTFHQLL